MQILQKSQILKYCRDTAGITDIAKVADIVKFADIANNLLQNYPNERFATPITEIADTGITNITEIMQKLEILQISQNYPKERFRTQIAEIADKLLQISKMFCKNRRYCKYHRIIRKRDSEPLLQKSQILKYCADTAGIAGIAKILISYILIVVFSIVEPIILLECQINCYYYNIIIIKVTDIANIADILLELH